MPTYTNDYEIVLFLKQLTSAAQILSILSTLTNKSLKVQERHCLSAFKKKQAIHFGCSDEEPAGLKCHHCGNVLINYKEIFVF